MAQPAVNHDWVAHAVCAADPPDALFVKGAAQRQARERCNACPVKLECLADALQWQCDFGVWGGLTERERRAIRRRFPDVENWREWLRSSDEELAVELRESESPRVLSLVRD